MRTIRNRNVNGRPKKSATEKMTKKVTVKFAVVEYYLLSNKAKEAGVSLSVFIRSALQNCTVRERLKASHLSLIHKLTGMANNLNQIAKRANQAGYFSVKTESEMLAKSIDNIINEIQNDC